jgi:8-oxo-dGTP diphosphatase
MARTERAELTVLCLIEKGSAILLQNRVKKDWQGYTLPGGHIEPGESIVDAVVREIREETGLSVLDPHLCGVKQFPIDGGRYLVFLFKAKSFTGTLRASEEGSVEWIERSELPMLPTVADFAELLSVFDRDDLSEFQYVIHGTRWDAVLK